MKWQWIKKEGRGKKEKEKYVIMKEKQIQKK